MTRLFVRSQICLKCSIAQDIIHCSTKGRVKLPKHTSLAMCVHHLTSSKRLIELLNRMGHCVFYDEMRAVNTSIAEEVLAKVEEFATVIPTNIKPGAFVQIAANNNDLNEEALDGKNTTHATTILIYQNKTCGPDPPPNLVEQRAKWRSLQATGTVYDIEECPVRGRRPIVTDHVGSVNVEWYKDANDEIRTVRNADFIWVLRLCPKKFGEAVIAEVLDRQAIPSWAGFNAILYPEMTIISNIGYCPMINGSSNDYSTIYTVLKHAQKISAMYGLQDGEQTSHKEATARRVKRDEEDVKKMMSCFSSGLMTDTFTHDSDELLNIATGVVLPEDVAQRSAVTATLWVSGNRFPT